MMDGEGYKKAADNWENWCEDSYYSGSGEHPDVNPFED